VIRALIFAAVSLVVAPSVLTAEARPSDDAIDAEVAKVMKATGVQGLALGYIENGTPVYVKAFGKRNAKGDPLQTNTVMYGASLVKALFGFYVVQLAHEGKLNLDASIATYLPKPLPDYPTESKYAPWSDLKNDERWRRLTPRILLTHSSGFANFHFFEPDEKLKIHFEPGSRYGYSGEGLILLQFVIEKGLGLDVGEEMQRRIFDPLGMTNSAMMWRDDFANNMADGWDINGNIEPHDPRSRVRVAGSMDTTIDDMARAVAGYVTGAGIAPEARAALTKPYLPITTLTQFPSLQPEAPPAKRHKDVAAGLGVIVFKGPQGPGFYKGGHDDTTANTWVCVESRKSCVVILSNDVRAEAGFPRLVKFLLGETGVPWRWEYGDMKFVP
jgi:CubicO group peptidase (beta-lactamase class C family)